MFYERFIEICNSFNVKPTPVLKELNISPGNLKRWEGGATINADTLSKIANYFNVSADYFLIEETDPKEIESIVISDSKGVIERTYTIARTNPQYVASILGGREVTYSTLERIAGYLRCSIKYLLGKEIEKQDRPADKTYLSDKELVIDVLSRLPYSQDYKYLQVMISRLVVENLKRNGRSEADLLETGMSSQKVKDLFDSNTDNNKILAFTNSDLMRLAEHFEISYDAMFTGQQ